MPTAILRPAAIGTHDGFALTAGATKVAAVDTGDPVSHNDATSYLTSSSNAQSFTVLSAGSPVVGVLSSLLLKIRVLRDIDGMSPADMNAFVRVSGADGVQQTVSCADNGVWTTYTAATNPLKSGSVALAPLDIKYSNTDFQMAMRAPGGAGIPTTSFWGEMTYVSPPGGFTALIAALGPLVAVGLHEMPRLARAVLARTETLIAPEEYLAAWRELREGRRARTFLMGMA